MEDINDPDKHHITTKWPQDTAKPILPLISWLGKYLKYYHSVLFYVQPLVVASFRLLKSSPAMSVLCLGVNLVFGRGGQFLQDKSFWKYPFVIRQLC